MLAAVADRIRANIRSTDIAARMGGDEFVIFMEYQDSVLPQTKRIFKRLTEKYCEFDVGISMGVACSEDASDYETLFLMADTAMYSVKRDKKNGFAFYDQSMKGTLKQEN